MKNVYTILLIIFIPICFVCDILFGSVHIPFDAFVDVLSGEGGNELWYNISVCLVPWRLYWWEQRCQFLVC